MRSKQSKSLRVEVRYWDAFVDLAQELEQTNANLFRDMLKAYYKKLKKPFPGA